MLNTNLILLALVQGVTEFLPVSSSAHLVLIPEIAGWPKQGLNVDISLHIGTLFALMIYFFRDVIAISRGTFRFNLKSADTHLLLKLIIAVIPIIFAGLLLRNHIDKLHNLYLISITMAVFGVLLYAADKYSTSYGDVSTITYQQALIIGLAQCASIVPGVSRSGITMTAARTMGISRPESARFSMLLSIPTIGMAGLWVAYMIYRNGESLTSEIIYGALFSCAFGLIAIWSLMSIVKKHSFLLFAVYRVILGIFLLAYATNLV